MDYFFWPLFFLSLLVNGFLRFLFLDRWINIEIFNFSDLSIRFFNIKKICVLISILKDLVDIVLHVGLIFNYFHFRFELIFSEILKWKYFRFTLFT